MDFPLYIGSKKENMPKELHEVKMHAQDFQESIPKYKEKPSEKDTKWRNHHLEDIKDTSRNEISIETHKIISLQKRGWFQTNKALYKVGSPLSLYQETLDKIKKTTRSSSGTEGNGS